MIKKRKSIIELNGAFYVNIPSKIIKKNNLKKKDKISYDILNDGKQIIFSLPNHKKVIKPKEAKQKK